MSIASDIRICFPAGCKAVSDKADEINKLNVFPVPDGDTGTNMSLTLNTVVSEVDELPADADLEAIAKAVTHGSLMGARGNSGVITSQILRGVAEGLIGSGDEVTTGDIARAMRNGMTVAFKAVRKPVEGTILTVLRDVSAKADQCAKRKLAVEETVEALVEAAYESVARTPDLLPVLKENGVVDSGAFGFATFIEGYANAFLGKTEVLREFATTNKDAKSQVANRVDIEINDDWEGSEFRYCTEFLFHAEDEHFDEPGTLDFLSSMGDCELLVGAYPDYKIHVHSNEPHVVLGHMLEHGQIFEVFVHNMDLEAKDRTASIAADKAPEKPVEPPKPLGFVAVAAGSGQAEILHSLGVDVVVFGGQTMNPSTADILDAVERVNAENVIVMPGNGNIVMASEAAAAACEDKHVVVVKAKSVPQEFSAMSTVDLNASLDDNVAAMEEAIAEVHDGEVTRAVRDSAAADGTPIHDGDVMGIADGEIVVVGSDIKQVAVDLVTHLQNEVEGDIVTLLAGADMDDVAFGELRDAIELALPDLDIDAHRGEQPLYPVVFSIE